jgi:hypothetical protein
MAQNGTQEYYKSSVLVRLRAVDNMNKIEEIAYRVDYGEWQHDYPSGNSNDLYVAHSCQFTVDTEGPHIVEFYAVDEVGHIEDIKLSTFKIDMTAPTTNAYLNSISAPHNGWYTENVLVTLEAEDELSGVLMMVFGLDNGPYQPVSGSTHTFTVKKEGSHILRFYSWDNAGNMEDVNTIDIKIDKTSPRTNHKISGEIGDDGWYTSSVEITLESSDDLSGVENIFYSIDRSPVMIYEDSFEIENDGETVVNYYAVDVAGNIEKGQTIIRKL